MPCFLHIQNSVQQGISRRQDAKYSFMSHITNNRNQKIILRGTVICRITSQSAQSAHGVSSVIMAFGSLKVHLLPLCLFSVSRGCNRVGKGSFEWMHVARHACSYESGTLVSPRSRTELPPRQRGGGISNTCSSSFTFRHPRFPDSPARVHHIFPFSREDRALSSIQSITFFLCAWHRALSLRVSS